MFNRLNVILILIASGFILTISFLYINRETYGSIFIEEIRIADQDAILASITDAQLTQLGREICSDVNKSSTLTESNIAVSKLTISILSDSYTDELVKSLNRLVIILRYQAIYELCPDKVPLLSNFIEKVDVND